MIVEALIVVGATATGVCLVRGHRMLALGAALESGVAALAAYLALGAGLESVVPGIIAAGACAAVMLTLALTRTAAGSSASQARPAGPRRLGRAVVGGLIGVVPGALVLVVPLLVHEAGRSRVTSPTLASWASTSYLWGC